MWHSLRDGCEGWIRYREIPKKTFNEGEKHVELGRDAIAVVVRDEIIIYTLLGTYIHTIPITQPLLGLKWVNYNILVTVFTSGTVIVYSPLGELLHQFHTIDNVKRENGALLCCIGEEAIVLCTGKLNLLLNKSIVVSKPTVIARCQFPPTSIHLAGDIKDGGGAAAPIVIVLYANGSFAIFNNKKCVNTVVPEPPTQYRTICVSTDSYRLACLTNNSTINIYAGESFTELLDTFAIPPSPLPPILFGWLGAHGFIVVNQPANQNYALFIGDGAKWIPFFITNPMGLVMHRETTMVVSHDMIYCFSCVPTSVAETMSPKASGPGKLLYQSWIYYKGQNDQCNSSLQSVKSNLSEAVVATCMSAREETDYDTISDLLNAARFGILLLESNDNSKLIDIYMESCMLLRISLAIMDAPTELLYTPSQLLDQRISSLMNTLMNRNLHLLALRIGQYAKQENLADIIVHYVSQLVKHSVNVNDDDLLQSIMQTINKYSSYNPKFVDVAVEAYRANRSELASKLLTHEHLPEVKVRTYIKLGLLKEAFQNAALANDADLLSEAIMTIKCVEPALLETTVIPIPRILSFYASLELRAGRSLSLIKFFERYNLLERSGYASLIHGIKTSDPTFLAHSAAYYTAHSKLTQEHILSHLQLLEHTRNMESSSSNISIGGVLFTLYKRGQTSEAKQLESMLSVPSSRAIRIHARALLSRDPPAFEAFLSLATKNRELLASDFFINILQQNGSQVARK